MCLCTECHVSVYRLSCFCVQVVMCLCTGCHVSVYRCHISVYRLSCVCVQSVTFLCTGCHVSVFRLSCVCVQGVMFLCTGCHVSVYRFSIIKRRLMLAFDIAFYYCRYIWAYVRATASPTYESFSKRSPQTLQDQCCYTYTFYFRENCV
jgi:hypothetical protein